MASKLGFHIQQRRHGWPNVVADAVPALVKSLEWSIIDDWLPDEQFDLIDRQRALKWTKQRVFLLGRHRLATQDLQNPEDRASEFWRRLLGDFTGGDAARESLVLARMRRFDAWEGYNEAGAGDDIRNLGRFDALLARRFHDAGLRYAGGGFSTTKPTPEEWIEYCAALLEEVDAGRGERPDFAHFHEYWYPPADWSHLLDADGYIDVNMMRAATLGYMLHWRELYEHPLTPQRLKLPVIISECGWDRGYPRQTGYRLSPHPCEDYVRWLVWYDVELRRPLDGVDYVVGAAIFTYGHTSDWASFEIDDWDGQGIMGALRAYLREHNQEPHPWAWQEAWRRAGGEPSAEESHYVLMAPNITLEWRHALDRYLESFRATNGQALLDAQRLVAARQHVTLVGSADSPCGVPQHWEDEIRRRNPHINVDRLQGTTPGEVESAAADRVDRGDRYGQAG